MGKMASTQQVWGMSQDFEMYRKVDLKFVERFNEG